MTSSRDTLATFIDAAADRVARVIVSIQREAERERELRDAQFGARMAELEARIAAVSEVEKRMADRLATLKDGEPGRDGIDGTDGKDGLDGVSPSAEDVAALIRADAENVAAEVARSVVEAWERPRDGRDGLDGKDADPELIRSMVEEALASLPKPMDGIDGKDGERGPEGPVGKLPSVRAWVDGVHYEGDVVTLDGSVYQAACDTGKAPPHEDWICIVSAGKDGEAGRSFSIRGTYSDEAAYSALDVVALNGASFAAKRDDPGPCPGDGWQLIAAQGRQGKPGAKGDTGMGLRGLPGDPVRDMTISDDGMLVLVNGDGSRVECDLYPILSSIGG